MNLNVTAPKRTFEEIFPDAHDANAACHYVTMIKTDGGLGLIHRDLTGHFHRTGPHRATPLDSRTSSILDRLQRNDMIKSAKKPEYFGDGNVGYRMVPSWA